MSFSLQVKEELALAVPGTRHCQIAELASLIGMCGNITTSADGEHGIFIASEHKYIVGKCQQLIKKAFGYDSDVAVRYNSETKNSLYLMMVGSSEVAIKILLATKLMNQDGSIQDDMALVSKTGINNLCCKRAYLRGAFLAGGSVSDPEKSYHLEIVTTGMRKAEQIMDTIHAFELDARIVARRRYFVVYLKEGSQIADMLNVMGAHVSLMNLENVRVVKEVRNSINRQVNCETANMGKTINAAVKQIEDIKYIKDNIGFDNLSEGLEEIAEMRLMYPDMPLKDLGTLLVPAVGKSGVNHRLRKISRIAEDLREKKEDREEIV